MPPVSPRERPTTIARGNDLDIVIDGATVRGVLDDTLTLRGYLAWEEADAVAIDPSLESAAVAQGGNSGDYIAPILGSDIDQLDAGDVVWIVAESVPPGAYRDAFPVTVVERQSA